MPKNPDKPANSYPDRNVQADNSISPLLTLPRGVVIHPSKLIYCMAARRYTWLCIDGYQRLILVCKHIGAYEKSLAGLSFCRIHHHWIVNMTYVSGYIIGRTGQVILRNGKLLPVSARRKKQLLQTLDYL